MDPAADLPDLKVWLAPVCTSHHHHHQRAIDYWEQQAPEQVLFCTVTALGLVRLVCQPAVMGAAMMPPASASALLDALGQQPGMELAEQGDASWETVPQLLRAGELPTRLWS